MQYELRQEFPFSIETVLKARESRYDSLDNQPGLKSQQLLSQEVNGTITVTRRLFRFGSAIPEIVKKMVPESLLEMVDTNHFDSSTNISQFTMQSEYSPDKIKIVATCPYIAVSPFLTVREYKVQVIVNVPIVGKTIAKSVADSHREALVKDHKIILDICGKIHIPPG